MSKKRHAFEFFLGGLFSALTIALISTEGDFARNWRGEVFWNFWSVCQIIIVVRFFTLPLISFFIPNNTANKNNKPKQNYNNFETPSRKSFAMSLGRTFATFGSKKRNKKLTQKDKDDNFNNNN
jgi:hypothetical protein